MYWSYATGREAHFIRTARMDGSKPEILLSQSEHPEFAGALSKNNYPIISPFLRDSSPKQSSATRF